MKPTTHYHWLLHYDLHIQGLENGSHFLMKLFHSILCKLIVGMYFRPDFLSPFSPFFCLNLREKKMKTHTKPIPFTTSFGLDNHSDE